MCETRWGWLCPSLPPDKFSTVRDPRGIAELRTSSTSSPFGVTTPTHLSATAAPASGSIGELRAVLVLRGDADDVDVVGAAEPRVEGGNLPALRLSAIDVRACAGHLIPTTLPRVARSLSCR